MVSRAGLSQCDFDAEFTSAEDCFLATLKRGHELVAQALLDAVQEQTHWLVRVRQGLLSVLRFLDSQPAWARVLVIETAAGGVRALELRERGLARVAELLERGSPEPPSGRGLAVQRGLTAELVIGGVFSVIHARMLRHRGMPLIELAPSLMSLIVLPYLGAEAANDELALKPELAPSAKERHVAKDLPARATYRTALVLRAIASSPQSNNREVAAAAGLGDEGQTSRMLSRLQRQGLIENVGLGQAYGEPNAWLLTAAGKRMTDLVNDGLGTQGARRLAAHGDLGRAACQR